MTSWKFNYFNRTVQTLFSIPLLKQTEKTKAPRAPALLGIAVLLAAVLELFPSTVSESSSHVSKQNLFFFFFFLMIQLLTFSLNLAVMA